MTHVHLYFSVWSAVAVINLQQRKQFRVIKGSGSGHMSSILIGLSIFRCGNKKSVNGRPTWELALCDCASQITEDFASCGKLVQRIATSVSALPSAEWFTFQCNFIFWTRLRP